MLKLKYSEYKYEAGCDEAGRGCLAGPVFASAVILPEDFHLPRLNDSKKLTADTRSDFRKIIEANAISWSVKMVMPDEIDELNILRASFYAMNRAIRSLTCQPDFIIIDGKQFENQSQIRYKCIVKGDAKYSSIAAASILAKTHRDEYMENLHNDFPEYNWLKNKGYPTLQHRMAVIKYGKSKHHRKTFQVRVQASLFD